MKRPRLNVLRTFAAAGKHLNFSRAGEDLNISQAAVSQQIRQLEAYLGKPLFVRFNRRLALTGTGDAYYRAVAEALDRLDVITDQLFPPGQDKIVTVRCTASIATLWLAPRMKSFAAACPGAELRIETLSFQPTVPTGGGHLEIVILDPKDAPADCRELMSVRIVPVCAPAYLKEKPLQEPADLAGADLIHVLGYEDDWHRWFRHAGIGALSIPGGQSYDGSLMALEAAANGNGVMLGRRPLIDHLLEGGSLVEPLGDAVSLSATYFLRLPETGAARRDVRRAVDWLLGEARNSPRRSF